jgi:hypothetical protein
MTITKAELDIAYQALAVTGNVATVIYAPFARTWTPALVVQGIIALSGAVARAAADVKFDEDAGPGIFYPIVIVESVFLACITRGAVSLLFKIPALRRFETHLRRL